jgi:rare lipoprotein A
MPLRRNNWRPARGFARWLWLGAIVVSLGAPCLAPAQVVSRSKQSELKKPVDLEGVAVWYSVPPNSLAKRRAAKDELTAAHNRLPLGTRVRVTHLGNGKNVVVRITDRGITKRRVLIDLCKEAAAKLDMLREGSARVRLEVLPDDKPAVSKTTVAPW